MSQELTVRNITEDDSNAGPHIDASGTLRTTPEVLDGVVAQPPPINYDRRDLAVGIMNNAADTQPGPQRNTYQEGNRWKQALAARWRKYGDYDPLFLSDRVVSLRDDGVYYPLDGNGSNHWLAKQYGDSYKVPCRIITGLTLQQENEIFQAIQDRRKAVTAFQKHLANAAYDPDSKDYQTEEVLIEVGFHPSSAVNDPLGIGVTAIDFVYGRYGKAGLRDTLLSLKAIFPDDSTARTNASLVKGLSVVLCNPDYTAKFDREKLFPILAEATAEALSEGARGRASENKVVERIVQYYAEATGELGELRAEAEAAERLAVAAAEEAEAAAALLAEAEAAQGAAESGDVPLASPAVPPVPFVSGPASAQGGDPELAGPAADVPTPRRRKATTTTTPAASKRVPRDQVAKIGTTPAPAGKR